MSRIDIDVLDLAGVTALLERAAVEGWNPGIDDAGAFHAADPEGFLALRIDGRFAAGISVVRLDASSGFLGLYIADPALRGRGHGYALWTAALERSQERGLRSIGLDGVVEQQASYRRSGFEPLHRNLRLAGSAGALRGSASVSGLSIRPATTADLPALVELDARIGGVRRERFCEVWFTGVPGSRITLVAAADVRGVARTDASGDTPGDAVPLGVATVRRCRGVHKIGPLIASDADVAAALAGALIVAADASEVVMDVPEPNRAAMELATAAGLVPTFETARMYRGPAPSIDVRRLYGVATLELG